MAKCTKERFRVTCTDCDMERETDSFDEAVTFAVKHHKHTAHKVDWERAELDAELPEEEQPQWEFQCNECGRQSQFMTKPKAEAFQQEHAQYADHDDSTVEEAEPVIELDDIQELLDYCFKHSQTVEIVPKQAVLTALGKNGETKRSVEQELSILETQTDVYELTNQYLARPSSETENAESETAN